MVKKRMCGYLKTVLVLLAIITLSHQALAASVGHGAQFISEGIFESGNYTFPDTLHIHNYLNVSGLLWVDPITSRVGIGTSSPAFRLDVYGDINTTGLLTNVTSCSNGFVSDANGLLYCSPTPHTFDDTSVNASVANLDVQVFNNATERVADNSTLTGMINDKTPQWGWTNATGVVYTTQLGDKVGIGTVNPSSILHLNVSDANAGAATDMLTLEHVNASGTVGAGIGSAIMFRTIDSASDVESVSMISGILSNVANGTERGALLFYTGYGDQDGIISNLSSSETMRLDTEGLRILGNLTVTGASHLGSMTFDTNATFSDSINVSEDLEAGGVLFVDGRYGNAGIGTTAPSKTLEVVGTAAVGDLNATSLDVRGLCVAEDSLISLADGSRKMIKDVQAGEKVLSLNEETGKIVTNEVKALLDMGVKPIYELTTESGRAINTTGNHPYLTPQGWIQVAELKEGDEIAVPELNYQSISLTSSDVENTLTLDWFLSNLSLDQIEQLNFNANAKYATSLGSGVIDFASFKKSLYSFSGTNVINHFITVLNSSKPPRLILALPLTSLQYDSSSLNANSGAYNFKPEKITSFLVREYTLKNEKSMLASTTNSNQTNFLALSSSNILLLTFLPNSKQSLSVNSLLDAILSSTLSNLSFLSFTNIASLETSLQFISLNSSISFFKLTGTDNVIVGILPPPIFNTVNTQNSVQIFKPFETLQVSKPRNCESNFLCSGSESGIFFDRIVSIREHAQQHVYDLAIEGTHNFIANDIIAHNTYISDNVSLADNLTVGGDKLYVDSSSGSVGIGTTEPGDAKLNVTGTIDAWQMTINGSAVGTVSGWTDDGTIVRLTTSTDSVGIGTTNPLYRLEVLDNASLSNTLFVTNDSLVGIGTASPTALLHLENSSAAVANAYLNISDGATLKFMIDLAGNIIQSASAYINYGATAGSGGYGIRDNTGTIQRKNSGGVWEDIAATSASAGGWTDDGGIVRLTTGTDTVGIGTSTPEGGKLYVSGNGTYTGDLVLGGDLVGTEGSGSSGAGLLGWTDDGTIVRLATSTDYVGIGTTTPSNKLEVAGDLNVTGGNTTLYGGFEVVNSSNTANSYLFVDNETGNVSIGTLAGILKADTGILSALSIVANQKLFGNAAGTAPEFATGIKIGTFTRNVGAASGTVGITGVGFKPSHVIFLANIPNTVAASVGMSDVTNNYNIMNTPSDVTGYWSSEATTAIYFLHSANVASYMHLDSMDADGFTCHWFNDGGTGTATVFYMAFR